MEISNTESSSQSVDIRSFCLEFDPYKDLSNPTKREFLKGLGLAEENLENPFAVTNFLLKLLDEIENQKQKPPEKLH